MAQNDRVIFSEDAVGALVANAFAQQAHIADAAQSKATGIVVDDDSAATNGTDVIVNHDVKTFLAHLESTAANNADAAFAVGDGGPELVITDNDTPVGAALHFNETTGEFLADMAGYDMWVPLSDGRFLKVLHDASASTNGVAVHFDDDAVNKHERLLFVSPTDTNGSFDTVVDSGFSKSDLTSLITKLNSILVTLETATLQASS